MEMSECLCGHQLATPSLAPASARKNNENLHCPGCRCHACPPNLPSPDSAVAVQLRRSEYYCKCTARVLKMIRTFSGAILACGPSAQSRKA
eukprot:9014721-Pyramimonas_sp.AAC.1